MKDTVIIYHSPCLDGFGGAYAAWKKFGDNATYLPMRRSKLVVEGFEGKDVYFIDFTYPQDLTDAISTVARSVTVLDHHAGSKAVVESVPRHVFDNDRSGATIAWEYFHPTIPVPRMLNYIEDVDLWRHTLPFTKEAALFLSIQPFDYKLWDKLVAKFDNEVGFEEIKQAGAHYAKYHEATVEQFIQEAFRIEFEGYKIMAANVPNFFASSVGNQLAQKHPPFALTWHAEPTKMHYSMRGNGEVDLAEVARRYGGNGHRNAAGFQLPPDAPPPFKRV